MDDYICKVEKKWVNRKKKRKEKRCSKLEKNVDKKK